jgi:thiol:disulfide interchange protein DsbA
MHEADDYIEHCQVSETPTIIVNGRYRVSPSSAGSYSRMAEIVKWLVAKCAKR